MGGVSHWGRSAPHLGAGDIPGSGVLQHRAHRKRTRMYDATMAETITITGHGGDQIEAYFSRPLAPGPFGGVVVIHHMPGYDQGTKEITRRFAAHGYNTICVNLYTREAPGASPDDAAAAARALGG